MKKTQKSLADLPPIRVRKEPPTIVEAVSAAQDLADDLDQQVEIAAGLIGLPAEDVRPHVMSAAQERLERPRESTFAREPNRLTVPSTANRSPRTVVVERRTRPAVVVERRGSRSLEPRR